MQYIKLDTDTWVEVDAERNTSQVVKKSGVEADISRLQGQIDALPVALTDEEKIAWYDAHVDESANEQSRLLIQAQIEAAQQKLSMLI